MGDPFLLLQLMSPSKQGSFGQREDAFFCAVANLAWERKLHLMSSAANSGARIGVAEEVKSCFRIGWSH